jgi:hypothetical protein
MAVLGAAAGIAGCSGPVKSLLVPNADAARSEAKGLAPEVAGAHWLRLRRLQAGSNFDIYLVPAHANYWTATNAAPHVAKVDEAQLNNGFLYVEALAAGISNISLSGKGGESLSIRIEVAGP